jgi:hypothetical protein
VNACSSFLVLHVSDRTSVNSGTARHHSADSVGFCLKKTT